MNWDLRPSFQLDVNRELVLFSSKSQDKLSGNVFPLGGRSGPPRLPLARGRVSRTVAHSSSVRNSTWQTSDRRIFVVTLMVIPAFPRPSFLVQSRPSGIPVMLLWSSQLAVTSQAKHLLATTPRHLARRTAGAPGLAEREPHTTGLWHPPALHPQSGTRCLPEDTHGDLRSSLAVWLPAAGHLTSSACCFWKSSPLPPTVPRLHPDLARRH